MINDPNIYCIYTFFCYSREKTYFIKDRSHKTKRKNNPLSLIQCLACWSLQLTLVDEVYFIVTCFQVQVLVKCALFSTSDQMFVWRCWILIMCLLWAWHVNTFWMHESFQGDWPPPAKLFTWGGSPWQHCLHFAVHIARGLLFFFRCLFFKYQTRPRAPTEPDFPHGGLRHYYVHVWVALGPAAVWRGSHTEPQSRRNRGCRRLVSGASFSHFITAFKWLTLPGVLSIARSDLWLHTNQWNVLLNAEQLFSSRGKSRSAVHTHARRTLFMYLSIFEMMIRIPRRSGCRLATARAAPPGERRDTWHS